MKRWILAICILLVMVGTVEARHLKVLGARWQWWENEKIRQDLGLTEDQVARIRALVRAKRGEMIDLKWAMEKKALPLADAVERQDFNLQEALAAAEEFQQARNALERARMALLLEIRGILNQEQFYKLRAMGKKWRRRFLRNRLGAEERLSKEFKP